MKRIYIFRGSPASGKGTITAEFLKQLPGKVVFLELDKFRWGFHLVNREVGDVEESEHQLAYENYLSPGVHRIDASLADTCISLSSCDTF